MGLDLAGSGAEGIACSSPSNPCHTSAMMCGMQLGDMYQHDSPPGLQKLHIQAREIG